MWTTIGCDEDGAAGTACRVDEECAVLARGWVCDRDAGVCAEVLCNSLDECGANRGCLVESGTLQGKCSPKECFTDADCAGFGAGFVCRGLLCVEISACQSNEDCAPVGKVCNAFQGQCVDPPSACSSDNDCVFPGTCDTGSGQCVSGCSSDGQCPDAQYCDVTLGECMAGCRVGGCPDGQTCDSASRTCSGGSGCTVSSCAATNQACDTNAGQCVDRTGKGLCEACTSDAECGGPGDRCARFGGTDQCTYQCEQGSDCPSGYQCANITSSSKACVPESFKCEGCLLDGCNAGDVCNPSTSSCQPQTATCRSCAGDFECGQGSGCETFKSEGNRCLPECGTACPQDYACNNSSGYCEPIGGSCSTCTLDPTSCGSRFLNDDLCACVDCTMDSHCPGALCAEAGGDCVTGTEDCASTSDCSSGVCYGATGSANSGVCVQCSQDSDCGVGNSCVNFACQSGGGCNPPCGTGNTCQNGVCVPDSTGNCNPACGAGEICDPNLNQCVPDTGGGCSPACASGEQCLGGICSCDVTGTCPAGQFCLGIFCIGF